MVTDDPKHIPIAIADADCDEHIAFHPMMINNTIYKADE